MSPETMRFLARHGWQSARHTPLAGDASARAYIRLTEEDRRAILMLAPPEDRAAFDAFVDIARRLSALGLSAPAIHATDPAQGLMLLEDLGCSDFTALGATLPWASDALVDVLVHLARAADPWPVPVLTPARMAEMTRIALPGEAGEALAEMEQLFACLLDAPPVPALRDVHAENLLWLPERAGLARVGLLDFQDAVMAPVGYDLVSYIHDARRDVPPQIAASATQRFVGALALDPDRFAAQAAALSFQRNLRILGVFRRLAHERGKPGYLSFLPRVFGHVSRALDHPALASLARAMQPHLPGIAP